MHPSPWSSPVPSGCEADTSLTTSLIVGGERYSARLWLTVAVAKASILGLVPPCGPAILASYLLVVFIEARMVDLPLALYAKHFPFRCFQLDLDVKQLADLREQLSCHLSDEVAEDMFKEHTRRLVEDYILIALEILKSHTRAGGVTEVVVELDKMLAFSISLLSQRNHPDANSLACGIRPVSLVVLTSNFFCHVEDTDAIFIWDLWIIDVLEIYWQKLQQCIADGELSEEGVAALLHLPVMLCIPQKTVEAAHADICGRLFEKSYIIVFFYWITEMALQRLKDDPMHEDSGIVIFGEDHSRERCYCFEC
ncbi:hypothetical protein Nepgr_014198 [Nepenthes gracilis]|uniref:Uncharacterized protein n=1 Tax=Nepenthes gracilis TaxID=150966 RepID=A0AAD3XPB0_NEPGR|nr:hypothetical protein Nepgr_014198 [Nepenthes gracilis]